MFVFRNYTIENLFPDSISFSGYEDISFIPEDEKDLVWLYQVPVNFSSERKKEIINGYFEKLSYVISNLKEGQRLYVCSLMDMFPTTIVDSDSPREDIENFNRKVSHLCLSNSQLKYLDLTDYFNLFPAEEWVNWKFYFISQMIVAPRVASGFYSWFEHRIAQLNGLRKKCLVLDLDNTLWGGILGEDGIEGIKIGGDYPGNVFLYFQQAILALAQTGIILTVCSKNNEADVKEAWEKNPFLKITDKNLSAWRINWNNKADNIRQIAAELNIGLDSMVFIDDNPTERELVKQQLPMVAVPDFPKRPYELMDFIQKVTDTFFRTPRLTSEDLNKTEQYRANAQRANASKSYTDLNEFIKSLEISLQISKADAFTIPRIAQMTQKTNQFNLTTRRYQEADIKNFMERGDWVVYASVKDKFGDNGITAAAIVNIDGDKAKIDSFLMSCRILGKGIEKAFLNTIINKLLEAGVKEVSAEYIPTAKNGQVASFFSDNGFEIVSSDESNGTSYILKPLSSIPNPDLYSIHTNF